MDGLLSWIGGATAPWADLYGSSAALATAVMFLHLGGLVAAGGIAFTLDRAVVRSARGRGLDRDTLARELHDSHLAVLVGLGVVVLSGAALTASDAEWFLSSPLFWVKMAIVAVLLANGWLLKRAGDRLAADPSDDATLRRLRAAAVRSAGLWAVALLAGVAITLYI